ncbi:MAG: phytanoyl-CoA dioxygenase family protein [Chloroflexota bacterium]
MFTPSERDDFAKHGLIKRDSFLPQEKIAEARKVIFAHLEQEGTWRDGDWCLDEYEYTVVRGAGMKLLKPLCHDQTMIDLINGDALAAATALLNVRPVFPKDAYPLLLFTLPDVTTWTVPHSAWHLDMPRLSKAGIPGVQIFALLETVEPSGGGTLVVTGSHRLRDNGVRMKSGYLRKKLMEEPYFSDLMSDGADERHRFLHDVGYVDDVEVKVVEMTGEAGDVYFMDMRMLHTVAPNALQIPRIMLTYRYLSEFSYKAIR